MKKHWEMADGDDPESIALAVQKSLIHMLRGILKDVRAEMKQPGLTWDQLDTFLEMVGKKKPEIYVQKEEF